MSKAAMAAPSAVLETKLAPPVQRPGLVRRTGLIERMAGASAPVVSISAPIGYGKTTLLVQYVATTERPIAWVSLDAGDDDPALLLLEIGTALDRISPVDPRMLRRLVSAASDTEAVLPHLVNLLGRYADLLLVFDDVHLVEEPSSRALISAVSERLPAGSRLVVASRKPPPLPLARLRVRGLLLELGQQDLALDDAEARALLADARAELGPDAFDALQERLEGWGAGIYLAALSLREAEGSTSALLEFTGEDRDVADYLFEEVLAHLPAERLSFLLGTSILDRFNAPLCDAVLRRRDSADAIDDTEQHNLFLVALDRRREWYRYHHLFSELLRAELARKDPRLKRTLHRRASTWHEQHGTPTEAIEHAFGAGEQRRAAELVARHAFVLYNSGLQKTIERWLGAFSETDAIAHPPLAIIRAWAGGLFGERDDARRYLALVERVRYDGQLPLGEVSLESAIAVLRAAHGWDGVSKMRSSAETAYRLEPPGSPTRGRAAVFLGASLVLSGKAADAVAPLEEIALAREGDANGSMLALGLLGFMALEEGRLDEAEERLRESLSLIEGLGLEDYLLAGPTHAALACLSAAQGDLDQARGFLERTISAIPQAASWPWLGIYLRVLSGRGALAIDEPTLAASLLEQARRALARYPDAGILPHRLAMEERALEAVQGGKGALLEPLTKGEQRVLERLPTHLTVEEIAHSLYISPNTVKGHLKAIYRKLEVGSRSEAVARARALRLLDRGARDDEARSQSPG